MGFLGVLVAVATAGGVVWLNPGANQWALGVGALGALIAAYLARESGRWAFLIAVLGLVGLGVGIYGVRTGAIPLGMALSFGLGGGLLLCLQGAVAGLFSLAVGDHKQTAFLAMVLAAGLAYLPLMQVLKAGSVPRIHDVTTDMVDPPVFVAIAPLREGSPNSATYGGAEVAAEQKKGYPDIQPVLLAVPPAEAFAKALAAAKMMADWQLVESVENEGRIEATATTRFMGFKDDIVIRIRPEGVGSRIDIRSVSRVGGSDVGANAARIREYLSKLTTL